jgi:hypothetical protein
MSNILGKSCCRALPEEEFLTQLQSELHSVSGLDAGFLCLEAIKEEQKRLLDTLADPNSVTSVDVSSQLRRALYILQIWFEVVVNPLPEVNESFLSEVTTLLDLNFEVFNLKTQQILELGELPVHSMAIDEIQVMCSILLDIGDLIPSLDLWLLFQLAYMNLLLLSFLFVELFYVI